MIYAGDCPAFYMRRLLLCACGIMGIVAWEKSDGSSLWEDVFRAVSGLGWKISWPKIGAEINNLFTH